MKPVVKLRLDASLLKRCRCKLAYKQIGIDGYKEKQPYNDTQYGSAFHTFVKVMYETSGNFAQAIEQAVTKYSQPCRIRDGKWHLIAEHLIKTCTDFWNYFHKSDNFQVFQIAGKPAVEVDFEIPFLSVATETTIYEVALCGTVDKIGKFTNGIYGFGDYKTNSLFTFSKKKDGIDKAIAAYFSQYELSLQLNFYAMCLKMVGKQNPDTELGRILSNPLGAFIDGVFLSGSEPTVFRRSDVFTYFDTDMMERLVTAEAHKLIELAQNPSYSDRDGIVSGACIDERFPCQFLPVCKNKDPQIRQIILNQNFKKEQYNPLLFGK